MSDTLQGKVAFYTYSLGLEGLDSLDVSADIVCHGLVARQNFFCLIDNGLVLQNRAVVREVYGGRLSLKLAMYPLGVGVTLAEGLEGSDSLCKIPLSFSKWVPVD